MRNCSLRQWLIHIIRDTKSEMEAVLVPDFLRFAAKYKSGTAQVVYTELVADLDTPVSAMVKLSLGEANSFLLESVEKMDTRGRYSIVGLRPDIIWRCHGGCAEIRRTADGNGFQPCKNGALDSLRELLEESRINLPAEMPPMSAGIFGYMAYDMVREVEKIGPAKQNVLDVPDGVFLRPTIVTIFDLVKDTLLIVTPVRPLKNMDAKTAYAKARTRLNEVVTAFRKPLPLRQEPEIPPSMPKPHSNMEQEKFFAMVERAKEYIFAGDIFQVVLSQRFATPFSLPPFALYRALRRINPSPFLYFLDFGDFTIVGSSPEILVRLRNNRVTIRPIAGTRRRGKNAREDERIGEELLRDEKERAEHLMLLDLGRNDVGRVALPRSIEVTEQFALQLTSHLIHMVSNVEGELAQGNDAMSALMAGFPAGTVSGAPKIRAMEIIDELEPEKRGIYAGCVGYFSAGGEMDSCIALRTAVVKDGMMYVQAGGGIVADSMPKNEYLESIGKAEGLFRAAEEAIRFAGG